MNSVFEASDWLAPLAVLIAVLALWGSAPPPVPCRVRAKRLPNRGGATR